MPTRVHVVFGEHAIVIIFFFNFALNQKIKKKTKKYSEFILFSLTFIEFKSNWNEMHGNILKYLQTFFFLQTQCKIIKKSKKYQTWTRKQYKILTIYYANKINKIFIYIPNK